MDNARMGKTARRISVHIKRLSATPATLIPVCDILQVEKRLVKFGLALLGRATLVNETDKWKAPTCEARGFSLFR